MKRKAIKNGVVIVNNNSDSKNTKEGVEMIEKNVLTTRLL